MRKNVALEKIESHEKLCRIMQKQTHQKINNIESEIKDIKRHMYYAMSALIGGMFTIIVILFQKVMNMLTSTMLPRYALSVIIRVL